MIDLHSHTIKSDGTYSPKELVDYAVEKGLKVLAITDHDTIDGLEEAISYAEELRAAERKSAAEGNGNTPRIITTIVPGIEFSTEFEGQDIHIVGLNINYRDEAFCSKLSSFLDSRDGRNRKMAQKLREVGIGISYEGLLEMFPNCVLTRAHFAKYLLEYGYVRSQKEAFDRYLGPECPCYVPREKVTPAQAVQMTLEAGGIPILAHPCIYHLPTAKLERLVTELKEAGLIGIEAIYCTHSQAEERQIRTLAASMGLCISGGSDFHGGNKPDLDLGTGYGHLYVPDEVWDNLLEAKQRSLNK